MTRSLVLATLVAASVAAASLGSARAQDPPCNVGTPVKATGTVGSVAEHQGAYYIQLAQKVIAKPTVPPSALAPAGDCLVGWLAGVGELTCKAGDGVTASGPADFDSDQVAGIQVRELSCAMIAAFE